MKCDLMSSSINYNSDYKLILCCSRRVIDEETRSYIESYLLCNLNWDNILKIAFHHKLLPLLYWNLKPFSQNVPDDVMGELREYFYKNLKKNLLMMGELLKIQKLLDLDEINSIPYKGPLLSILAYGNLGLRDFNDLDIYVNISDVSRTMDILVENGYKSEFYKKNSQNSAFCKYQREYSLINNIPIEIKWKFMSPLFSINRSFDFHLNNYNYINYFNSIIKTLSNEELIIVLSIHNVSHYWSHLLMICDISEIIKSDKFLNWHQIIQNATEMGVARILFVNLLLVNEIFGTELPEIVVKHINNDKSVIKISKQIIEKISNGKNFTKSKKLILRINLRERYINKYKDFINMVFLPTRGVIEFIPLPESFFPLYRLLRFLQLFLNVLIK